MTERRPRLLIVGLPSARLAIPHAALREQRLDVLLAPDGSTGPELVVDSRPDLILLVGDRSVDAQLALCQRLKADPRTADLPLLLLAARMSIADKLRGFALGAADILEQPVNPAELVARLGVHLRNKRELDRLQAIVTQPGAETLDALASKEDQLFARATERLRQALRDWPDLGELARELGCSERKLNRVFVDRLGMTVRDYAADLRLQTACRLLAGSNARIQNIADRIGYRNAGDFTRAFRRRYAVSPRDYRKERTGAGPDPVAARC